MHTPIMMQAPEAALGECPRYDAATKTLSWVDLSAGRLWCADTAPEAPLADTLRHPRLLTEVTGNLACAVRRGAPGGRDTDWLLCNEGTVLAWTEGQAPRPVVEVEPDHTRVRLSDGVVGPDGGLWVGSIPVPRPLEPWGRMHRITGSPDPQVETLMDGLLAANGMGWSPDAATLYVVDSGRKLIHRLRRDGEGRTAEADEPLSTVEISGTPDGITVDAAGCVWVAMWDGGTVVRLSPDGAELDRVLLPCSRPTACALVDRRLVITTARVADEPWSGRLFAVDVDVPGLPALRAAWH
ncbi:SMP-30/gluconolactonase/LRE family protein [Streptomyces sp. NPDC001508]|uniref:SMP-30/gluconolactonase/LRE family protein n=1 Tax=Streptomyces sp. NPDC001508 TaxID=3154656 RepID=UPI003319E525